MHKLTHQTKFVLRWPQSRLQKRSRLYATLPNCALDLRNTRCCTEKKKMRRNSVMWWQIRPVSQFKARWRGGVNIDCWATAAVVLLFTWWAVESTMSKDVLLWHTTYDAAGGEMIWGLDWTMNTWLLLRETFLPHQMILDLACLSWVWWAHRRGWRSSCLPCAQYSKSEYIPTYYASRVTELLTAHRRRFAPKARWYFLVDATTVVVWGWGFWSRSRWCSADFPLLEIRHQEYQHSSYDDWLSENLASLVYLTEEYTQIHMYVWVEASQCKGDGDHDGGWSHTDHTKDAQPSHFSRGISLGLVSWACYSLRSVAASKTDEKRNDFSCAQVGNDGLWLCDVRRCKYRQTCPWRGKTSSFWSPSNAPRVPETPERWQLCWGRAWRCPSATKSRRIDRTILLSASVGGNPVDVSAVLHVVAASGVAASAASDHAPGSGGEAG